MKTIGTVCLTILGAMTQAAWAAETVNWQVTVSAMEEISTQAWQEYPVTVGLNSSGGVKNYAPPQGTTRIDITVAFPITASCTNCGESFSGIPHTYPYYAVWYTYLGGDMHRVQVFGGNVGGALLRESVFSRYCPNGYRQMSVMFDALVTSKVQEPRAANAVGTLVGGQGEVLSAPWQAAPQAINGGTLTGYTASVAGDNPKVEMSLTVSDNISGTVTAKFPACIPAPELCDGVDNDCDGDIDEDQGVAQCGAGACANSVPACVDGKLNACAPLPASSEVCDGVDNNCDGAVDEGLGSVSCGSGLCANTVSACVGGSSQSCSPLPGSAEACDGIDNDCDGVVDNGCPRGILNILEHFTNKALPPGIQRLIDKVNSRANAGIAPTSALENRVDKVNDRLDQQAEKKAEQEAKQAAQQAKQNQKKSK
ncbi:MAG: putative metal-binding motif-containing protein [Elusimicrobia bacterium]|nr:putative metal-binding motif-containing protein [Elusimicrobiota bacterium]